jgi:hypothetical protein
MADGFTITDLPSDLATEKRPLHRELLPAPAFPVEALGPLRDPAEAIQMVTQAPMAICAQSVLAAATLAVQHHRDVGLPGGGRKPLTELFFTVAESGERKSSVDKIALAPVRSMERRWMETTEAEKARHSNDLEAWKAAREQVKKKHSGNRAALREALDVIGPEPRSPLHPMLTVENVTPEGIERHLAEGRPWCGLFSAEGGAVIGGHGFSDDARMRMGALLNKLWDGDTIRRSRSQGGAVFLPGRRCSTHIMMQPAIADKLFGDAMLDSMGLMARALVVAPESTAGTRCWRETPPECRAVLDAYDGRLEYLLSRPPATAPGTADVLDPPALRVNAEAQELWVQFYNWTEAAIGRSGEWQPTKSFGAKAAEHAGRLAAVLTVYGEPDAMEVSSEAMACGIALAQHYGAELLRLQDAATVSPDLRLATKLLLWWQERPDPRLHLTRIYQRGPNALGDAATARRIVGILEDHGWVRRLDVGTVVEGAERREAWELTP